MRTITERLQSLPDVFHPLREHAERYLSSGAVIHETGVVSIGRDPKVAPEYFLFRLYQPAPTEWLVRRRSYQVPLEYLRFLASANGCFAYGMSLYGFAPSMESGTPHLSRTVLQCLDLTLANDVWRREFRLPQPLFHFGSRHYSHTENVGYFMEESGSIRTFLKSGRELEGWSDFSRFLQDELTAAQSFYSQDFQ